MSSQHLARIVGAFYVLNIAIGIAAIVSQRQDSTGAADWLTLAGAAEYVIVVLLLGRLFEPAARVLSWTVAAVGVAAFVISAGVPLHLYNPPGNIVLVFGPYCVGVGILVIRSRMMSGVIGLLLIVAGFSWMTFGLPSLSHRIAPWNSVAGAVPELLFTLWLLAVAVRGPTSREVPVAVPGAEI